MRCRSFISCLILLISLILRILFSIPQGFKPLFYLILAVFGSGSRLNDGRPAGSGALRFYYPFVSSLFLPPLYSLLSFPFVLFRFRLLLFWSFCSVGWLQLGGVGSVLVYPIGSISNFIFNGRKFYALIKICRRVLSAGELKFGLSIAISLFIFRLEFLDGTFPAGLAGGFGWPVVFLFHFFLWSYPVVLP